MSPHLHSTSPLGRFSATMLILAGLVLSGCRSVPGPDMASPQMAGPFAANPSDTLPDDHEPETNRVTVMPRPAPSFVAAPTAFGSGHSSLADTLKSGSDDASANPRAPRGQVILGMSAVADAHDGLDPPPGGRLTLPGQFDAPPPEPASDNRPLPPLIAPEKACPEGCALDDALAETNPRFTLGDDVRGLLPMLADDVKATVTWPNAIILGAAAGGAVAIRYHLDAEVRDNTAAHPQRWGRADDALRQFGQPEVQVPVIAAAYMYTLWAQDEETHDFMKALISGWGITSVTTVAIKGIADTPRPDPAAYGGQWGFPSYHTASTFAMAATIDEYYGWKAGLPAYAVAGLVGWSRIDQREHELSDVVFGAALGYVIGKSVAAAHHGRELGVKINPYYNPMMQSSGVILEKPF